MTFPEVPATLAPLAAVQAAFRQSPGRTTALAYMDAAILEWETAPHSFYPNGSDHDFLTRLQEIRDWLMNVEIEITTETTVKF